MKNQVRLFVSLVLTTMLALNSCSSAMAPGNTGAVPDSLQTIEAAAEDIIDFVPSSNWEKVSADVTTMIDAWELYQVQAGTDGISQQLQDSMTAALDQLETASQAKEAAATLQAANNVSAAVVEMFAAYNPKIPADISRLDVLERQVILDVAAQNHEAAMKTFQNLKSIWEKVRPSVVEHNGEEVIAQFEASLNTQESALNNNNNEALTSEAKVALELVDALEDVFR